MDNLKTDILVIGGGAAGIAAALSSARMGRKVILAEQFSYVGGLITGGLVTVFEDMGDSNNRILQEIIRELIKFKGVSYFKKDLDEPTVNPELFKIIVENRLVKEKVKILYNSYAYKVIKYNKIIKKVFFRNNYMTFSIEPKTVIDCTGNGDIFYYCNEPFKEYFSKDIPIGLVVRVGGISKRAENYIFSKEGEVFLKRYSIPSFLRTPMKSILWTIVDFSDNKYEKDGLKKSNEILIYLRKKALDISINLKKSNIFKDSFLLDTAPLLGIRLSRVLRGKNILTKECDDVYNCLLPKFTKNLLVAGRCISADLPIMDRMRLIPNCFATGEIAGVTAVKLIKEEGGDTYETTFP